MTQGFVWFHNGSEKPGDCQQFYQSLLGWKPAAGPPGMTMFGGDKGPFAAIGAAQGVVGWIPYAEVEDVDAATTKAAELGATVLEDKRRGPAGQYTIVRDPGGATLALWQRG